MSDQPNTLSSSSFGLVSSHSLCGKEGELLLVRISVDPRQLEDLLDCLANLPFPVNPQIYHTKPTIVEFPAYSLWIVLLFSGLEAGGFARDSVVVLRMLEATAVA